MCCLFYFHKIFVYFIYFLFYFFFYFIFRCVLLELELKDGAQLIVADVTSPNAIEFHLKLHAQMDT